MSDMKTEVMHGLKKHLELTDVEFRIGTINKGGYATLLAYKDARVDMNRLDEVCGANWQCDYKLIDSQLFCGIGIKFDNEWQWRWDVGVESFTEKEKGRASDAFKRAGFRWGIGRELYDYPKIQIKLNPNEYQVVNGKAKASYNFDLKRWTWKGEFKNNKIIRLIAIDEKNQLRYDSSTNNKSAVTTQKSNEKNWLNIYKKDTKELTPEMTEVYTKMKSREYTTIEQIKEHWNISKVNVSTIEAWIVKLNKQNKAA